MEDSSSASGAAVFRPEWMDALAAFAQGGPRPSDEVVSGVLQDIAKSGLVGYSWTALSALLADKASRVCDDYRTQKKAGSQASDASLFVQRLKSFARPPFTIQRLCELLLHPFESYGTLDKWLFALDRVISVSIMDEEWTSAAYNELACKLQQQFDETVRAARAADGASEWQMDVEDEAQDASVQATWMTNSVGA